MHSFWWTHCVFGLFLIYTGIKSATISDEHFDPRENSLFIFLSKYVRLVNRYDDSGRLFVQARVDPKTGESIEPQMMSKKDLGSDPEKVALYAQSEGYGIQEASSSESHEYRWHGTLLIV